MKSLIDPAPHSRPLGAILRQLQHGIDPRTALADSNLDPSPMPVTYQLRGTTIVVSLRGVYETADVRATLLAAFADRQAAGATGMLFNVSESRSINARTATEVRAMAEFLAQNAELFGRRLALVARGDAAFGLMRLGSVDVEQQGVDSRVFRDLADAEGWLAGRSATA